MQVGVGRREEEEAEELFPSTSRNHSEPNTKNRLLHVGKKSRQDCSSSVFLTTDLLENHAEAYALFHGLRSAESAQQLRLVLGNMEGKEIDKLLVGYASDCRSLGVLLLCLPWWPFQMVRRELSQKTPAVFGRTVGAQECFAIHDDAWSEVRGSTRMTQPS